MRLRRGRRLRRSTKSQRASSRDWRIRCWISRQKMKHWPVKKRQKSAPKPSRGRSNSTLPQLCSTKSRPSSNSWCSWSLRRTSCSKRWICTARPHRWTQPCRTTTRLQCRSARWPPVWYWRWLLRTSWKKSGSRGRSSRGRSRARELASTKMGSSTKVSSTRASAKASASSSSMSTSSTADAGRTIWSKARDTSTCWRGKYNHTRDTSRKAGSRATAAWS